MPVKPVVMPQLGESVAEATLARWEVKEGELVERDQIIALASTDKADTELPAPYAGRVVRLLVAEGEVVAVNAPIAELDTEAEARPEPARPAAAAGREPSPARAPPAEGARPGEGELPAERPERAAVEAAPPAETRARPAERARQPARRQPPSAGARPAPRESARTSPLVRRMAREHKVDVTRIQGTGASGRVTKDDLLRYLAEREPGLAMRARPEGAAAEPAPAAPVREAGETEAPAPEPSAKAERGQAAAPAPQGLYRPPPYRPLPGDRVVPFSRRRRLIAEHMVYSKQTSPHVPCMAEIQLHRVQRSRQRAAERGERVSVLAHVAAAIAHAAREYPAVNATVLEDAYVLRRAIHLGVAVDTPEGLVVPVVRDADSLSVVGLTRAIAELAQKARRGTLSADELSGGTITLSNPGPRGNVWGAAIINQPQVAILRMGEIIKRPVVVDLEGEDAIVVRPVATLVLSYDHRIVDGVVANGFLRRVKELLESVE